MASKSKSAGGELSSAASPISGPSSKDRAKYGRNLAATNYEKNRPKGKKSLYGN